MPRHRDPVLPAVDIPVWPFAAPPGAWSAAILDRLVDLADAAEAGWDTVPTVTGAAPLEDEPPPWADGDYPPRHHTPTPAPAAQPVVAPHPARFRPSRWARFAADALQTQGRAA
jgi:hypothetical protein